MTCPVGWHLTCNKQGGVCTELCLIWSSLRMWRTGAATVVQRHAVSRWPICFLSFPFIHNTEIKENDRHESERKKKKTMARAVGSNYKRLAERFSCTSSQHSSPRCWLAAQRCEWHHMHMFDSQKLAGAKPKGEDTCWFVDDEMILMCYDFETISGNKPKRSQNAVPYITEPVYSPELTELKWSDNQGENKTFWNILHICYIHFLFCLGCGASIIRIILLYWQNLPFI